MTCSVPAGAAVHLRRPKAYVDTGAGYRVLIDGTRRGVIRNDGELTLEVASGHHELQLRYFCRSSPVIAIDLAPGAREELVCRPAGSNNPFAVFYRMIFARKHYMALSR